MTPEERIAQLAAARGGVATFPRARLPRAPTTEPAEPTKTNGLDKSLPLAWRKLSTAYEHREHRGQVKQLETYLAAGVIVRYLGKDWRRELDEHGRISLIHAEGHGFRFGRDWHDSARFQSAPIDRYKRDTPPSITTSATRPLGAIARDIQARLIGNGLAEAWQQCQARDAERRAEIAARVQAIEATARAFGGRVLGEREWQSRDLPAAEIPGGVARINYGFDDHHRVEIHLTVDLATAARLGSALTNN